MKFKSPQTLASIAHLIQSRYVGNQNFKITGINEIHVVQPGDIVFVDHPKYYEKGIEFCSNNHTNQQRSRLSTKEKHY